MKAMTLIGCEAYITRAGQLLLGKRKNVYGSGTWALPGGHLEFLERADECLIRELKEEMNITVQPKDLELLALTDDPQTENQLHYIHLTFKVNIDDSEPIINEPDCCEEWRWFPTDKLPENIFPPHQKILSTINSQSVYKH